KLVGRDQVERRPFPHLTCLPCRAQIDIIILILPGVVDGRANIEAGEPRLSRAVIERADKGSIMWQRTTKVESERHKFTRKTNSFANRGRLKLKPREIGAVEGKGKSPKIPTTKDGGIQNIDRFVIKTFHDCPGQVQVGIDDPGDCASCRLTTHQSGEAVLEINNELWAN